MKEEVFKDYFLNWKCPRLRISNTCKLMVNDTVVSVEKYHDGRHFFFMHHKWRCLEIAMLKLFPELRAYYDKFGYKKKDSASSEIIAEIKQEFQNEISIAELSEKYKLTEDFIQSCVASIPKSNTVFMSNF